MTGLTIGLNIEFLAIVLMGLLIFYLIGVLYVNTYVNFTPKDIGRLVVIAYMLGVLTVAYLVGSALFIYVSLIITIVLVVFALIKLRGKKKNKKRIAAQQGGN